jgi:hypothetical protein
MDLQGNANITQIAQRGAESRLYALLGYPDGIVLSLTRNRGLTPKLAFRTILREQLVIQ